MSDATAPIAMQFDDLEQQRQTRTFGMWVFLATECMLFGGLFLCYTAYRHVFPEAFRAASAHTEFWIGTLNTAVLLSSSVTMALAVRAAQAGQRGALVWFLLATLALGTLFMGMKGFEYFLDYRHQEVPGLNFHWTEPHPNQARLFFLLYFIMTGLHAVHLTIGISLVTLMLLLAGLGRFSERHYTPIELTGLYWHLVDMVWVFLYPLLYLIHPHL